MRLIQKDSDKLFYCMEMGSKPDEVKQCYQSTPLFTSDTLLTFQNRNNIGGSDYREDIYCSFDEFGLFEIQIDYYSGPAVQDSLYLQITKELIEYYGQGSKRIDHERWTTNSSSNKQIEISLSKEYDDNDSLFISLNYLEPLNEEI